jgi:hypothetical protein
LLLGDLVASWQLMPYTNDVYAAEEIYMPGAIFLDVEFSDDTTTEESQDFVQLFMDPHFLVPVGDPYSGTDFPGSPLDILTILGSRFYFTFVSDDEFPDGNGYDMQVTPVYGLFNSICFFGLRFV